MSMSVAGETISVAACVAGVISAYRDGAAILENVRSKRAAQREHTPLMLLAFVIGRAPGEIEREEQRGIARFGELFKDGDSIAVSALQSATIHLQGSLLEKLRKDDESTNFMFLVDAADTGRDATIRSLLELGQRLLARQPISSIVAPSAAGFEGGTGVRSEALKVPARSSAITKDAYHEWVQENPPSHFAPNESSLAMESQPIPRKRHDLLFSFLKKPRRLSSLSTETTDPKATRQATSPLASRSTRASSPWTLQDQTAPSMPKSTFQYQSWEDDPARTWAIRPEQSMSPASGPVVSTSPSSISNSTIPSKPKPLLAAYSNPMPTPENNYLGFCKYASKLQQGDHKAMVKLQEINDDWSPSPVYYLACADSRCAFACHISLGRSWDKVWHVEQRGLKFRWTFLAKSHVGQSKVRDHQYGYQCLICIFLGQNSAVYLGTDAYLEHVSSHRVQALPDVVLYISRCIANRVADDGDDFDINLFPVTDKEQSLSMEIEDRSVNPSGLPYSKQTLQEGIDLSDDLREVHSTNFIIYSQDSVFDPPHERSLAATRSSTDDFVDSEHVSKTQTSKTQAVKPNSKSDAPEAAGRMVNLVLSPPTTAALLSRRRETSSSEEVAIDEQGLNIGTAQAIEESQETRDGTQQAPVSTANHDKSFDDGIASLNLTLVRTSLNDHFDSIAQGSWSWLHELRALGYDNLEIAELLLEQRRDRPWIHFDPWILTKSSPDPRHHIGHCVHQHSYTTQALIPSSSSEARNPGEDAVDMRSAVASLCGIGGIVPCSGTSSVWNKYVTFAEETGAVVNFGEPGLHSAAILDRLIDVTENVCTALAIVQRAKACCNTFTILMAVRQDSGHMVAELRPVRVSEVADFLHDLKEADPLIPDSLRRCNGFTRQLLGDFDILSDAVHDLQRCALVVQILTLGLVSYVQAHVGALDMFFLERKLTSVRLLGATGTDDDKQQRFSIDMSARRLSCLGDMLDGPVMVFTSSTFLDRLPERINVLATAEDLLDTWGPGGVVLDTVNGYKSITKLILRGGEVYAVGPDKFHWSTGKEHFDPTEASSFCIDEPLLIGAVVEANPACNCTEQTHLARCQGLYRPLGTKATHMRQQGLEIGAQTGQYGIITFNMVLEKVPGVLLKDVVLGRLQRGQDYISFLESSYGLQVSFCSGLARRVRMRDLLAELLPVYVNRQCPLSPSWLRLQDHYQISDVLACGDIRSTLQSMHQNDPCCFQELWHQISELTQLLKGTGLDLSNDTFTIAIIPSAAEEQMRCISFDAKGLQYWTKALRDTDTCATFAYFTLSCLQVGGNGCRNVQQNWPWQVLLLQTEVLRHLKGDTGTSSLGSWTLEHGATYTLGTIDADVRFNLLAQVVRHRATEDPRLLVRQSMAPAAIWKRLQQKKHLNLRERQGPSDAVLRAFMTSIDNGMFSFA